MELIRTLARLRHAVYGNVLMGAVLTIAGLVQANVALMGAGIGWILLSCVVLVLTFTIDRGTAELTFVGEIVVPQQPQLPDVQTHMRCTPELPQAA